MLNKLFRKLILKHLRDYTKSRPFISSCYVRHSAAASAQNPCLADFDLAFFINAGNICDLQKIYQNMYSELTSNKLTKRLFSHFIVLPATKEAEDLCKLYYPFRSIYPISSWLSLSEKQTLPSEYKITNNFIPLDHSPENGMLYYMIPALQKKIRRHPLEPLLLKRLIKKDFLYAGLPENRWNNGNLCSGILTEIEIWNEFYKKTSYSKINQKLELNDTLNYDFTIIKRKLNNVFRQEISSEKISSAWVYPSTLDDNTPNLCLNLDPDTTVKQLMRIINSTAAIQEGMNYNLVIGREQSMTGRINGLSRLNLLEPWLFENFGQCIWGSKDISNRINKPDLNILKQKYNEFLLYFSYGCLLQGAYSYNFYKLCFIMDYLFNKEEIILDENKLSKIYGNEFILKKNFEYNKHTSSLLLSLQRLHGFSVFPRDAHTNEHLLTENLF